MLETFRNKGCNMSLKLHFLHRRLPPPPQANFETSLVCIVMDISPRYFHHGKRCKGTQTPAILADYCWQLKRKNPAT
jgi:hypothetical protein